MPDDIKLTRDEEYASIGQTWQLLMAMHLDRAMLIGGVHDPDKRRAICDHFFSDFGMLQDDYWFEVRDKRYFPIICFSIPAGGAAVGGICAATRCGFLLLSLVWGELGCLRFVLIRESESLELSSAEPIVIIC